MPDPRRAPGGPARGARERTEATAKAAAQWRRLDAIRSPRALYVASSLAPVALAPDMLFLAICLWWFAREAFLPPVRIDEVYELEEQFLGRKVDAAPAGEPSAPGAVREWDDHASDRVNFIGPAVLVALFATLEAVLIWSS